MAKGSSSAEVDSFGLRVWRGEVVMMNEAHRHHELEFNFIFQGSMTYLFGGRSLTVQAGQFVLLWGALPHRLIAREEKTCEEKTVCGWLTLPLGTFLQFDLPDTLTQRVLQGTPVLVNLLPIDHALYERWLEDWQSGDEKRRELLERELNVWLERLALNLSKQPIKNIKKRHDSKAARLAKFLSEHYQEPLQIRDVANRANLNESYAATLFKTTFSMTILDYLTQHRIAHAQRLLVTTNRSVLEIAFDAGFGSSSQFYSSFVKACGQTPLAYRKRVRS